MLMSIFLLSFHHTSDSFKLLPRLIRMFKSISIIVLSFESFHTVVVLYRLE